MVFNVVFLSLKCFEQLKQLGQWHC